MASNRSFTISQPFLGAPLQFQPALNSCELTELVNAYIIGETSFQEKLSVVTIDFFINANVDINTGARVRHYKVFYSPAAPLFEQSPAESHSSGFSPSLYTPSPGSSATFGDSGYGSFNMASMTPPSRTMGSSRVTKSAKKEVKKPASKVDEARLPGFSIMTKDGIDVTTTAGRGTKTKEQREHAHLMRKMKACDACKRKKIRCDPSHRRSTTERSRTTSASSSSHPSSSRSPAPRPALTRESTRASSTTVFTPSNPIDDFVLFPEPEDDAWNPAEMSQTDFGHFDFGFNAETDLNDYQLDEYLGDSLYQMPPYSHQQQYQSSGMGDFGMDPQPFEHQRQSSQALDNYGFESEPYASHVTGVDMDDYLAQQDSNPARWAHNSLTTAHTRPHPSSSIQDSGQMDANIPHMGWSQSDVLALTTMSQGGTDGSTPLSATSDWNLLESTMLTDSPLQQRQSSSPESSESMSRSHNSRRSRPQVDDNANRRLQSAAYHESAGDVLVDPSDVLDVPLLSGPDIQCVGYGSSAASAAALLNSLAETSQEVSASLRGIKSSRSEYTALRKELQTLQTVLTRLSTSPMTTSPTVLSEAQAYETQLRTLSTLLTTRVPELEHQLDPIFHPELLRQCQIQARRLVRSLCATINSTQAQNSGTHERVLTSGRNLQLYAPDFDRHLTVPDDVQMWVESTMSWQLGNGSMAVQAVERDAMQMVDVDGDDGSRMKGRDGDGELSLSRTTEMVRTTVRDAHQHALVTNDTETVIERSLSDADANTTADREHLHTSQLAVNDHLNVTQGRVATLRLDAAAPEQLVVRHTSTTSHIPADMVRLQTSRSTTIQDVPSQETTATQSATAFYQESAMLQTTASTTDSGASMLSAVAVLAITTFTFFMLASKFSTSISMVSAIPAALRLLIRAVLVWQAPSWVLSSITLFCVASSRDSALDGSFDTIPSHRTISSLRNTSGNTRLGSSKTLLGMFGRLRSVVMVV